MTRAQDKRVWLAGGAAVALLILAVGWIAVINPQLSSTSAVRGQADSARAQNAALTATVAKLKRQNDNVGQLKATLRAALAGLPFDTGLPAFTLQLADQATRTRVSLSSITVGSATATTTAGTTTTAGATTSTGTTTSTTPATTAGTGAPASTAPAPAATAPAAGSATAVMSIPITLLSKGTSAHQLAFLKAIQVAGPRRALVLSTILTGAGTSGQPSIDTSSTMTIQLSIFSAPLDAAGRATLTKLLSAK
jgi:hypothetical protein